MIDNEIRMTDERKTELQKEHREWELRWKLDPLLKIVAYAGRDIPDACLSQVSRSIVDTVRQHDAKMQAEVKR